MAFHHIFSKEPCHTNYCASSMSPCISPLTSKPIMTKKTKRFRRRRRKKISIFLLLLCWKSQEKCRTIGGGLQHKQASPINLVLLVYQLPLLAPASAVHTITYRLSTVSRSNKEDCEQTFQGLGRERVCNSEVRVFVCNRAQVRSQLSPRSPWKHALRPEEGLSTDGATCKIFIWRLWETQPRGMRYTHIYIRS